MAFHQDRPQSVLVICFGMGTSYRSALSWDADTTVVELVPDVPNAFGYYHADAAEVLKNPKGRIIIDDGRRFLERTQEKYDVVTIDPPPPLETAGSSLLYSTEFYAEIKQHLKQNGIIQVWLPGGEKIATQAVAGSICSSFPSVRCFLSVEGWGVHILASMDPIPQQTADQLAARMPPAAQKDLLEWASGQDARTYLGRVVSNEAPPEFLLNSTLDSRNPDIRITDDHPVNEYFLLRQTGWY
jgi:spermidine synthase